MQLHDASQLQRHPAPQPGRLTWAWRAACSVMQQPDFAQLCTQDATEYLQHLLEVMTRAERAAASRTPAAETPGPTARAFDMGVESRVQCGTSGAVSYTKEATNVWSLSIPLDSMTNRAELEASQVCA